jgi:hypothetical protein
MERKRDKNFSIIFDGSLAHTVFYPTNSTSGNKGSSAMYVPFHVLTLQGHPYGDIYKGVQIKQI